MLLRPYGVVIDGHLELGVELLIAGGEIVEIRPHTGIPEPFVVSPAFVNAHSHLEYRGMLHTIEEPDYWPWIRELTRQKGLQDLDQVQADAIKAAHENRASGVALLAEHSDRPVSGQAMTEAGLRGAIFQEVITFFERESREEKLRQVDANAQRNAAHFAGPIHRAPHAYQTVDRQTHAELGASGQPLSIHVAETPLESLFTRSGEGLIAEFYRAAGFTFEPTGKGVVESLDDLGVAREGVQFVHCCAVDQHDIELLAQRKVTVAHCPRSNTRLRCPDAPVREMLDAGLSVGLGLDSAASGGPIDMFAEMREAIRISLHRARAVSPEETWRMATRIGAASIRFATGMSAEWDIYEGSRVPIIKLHIDDAHCTEDLILRGSPELVEWV